MMNQAQPLGIDVALRVTHPPAGAVVLTNIGDGSVRLRQTGKSWGDDVLSFDVEHEGSSIRFVGRPQVYTRNVSSSLVMPAGGEHRLYFDLVDSSCGIAAPLDRPWHDDARLVAVYAVDETPEAREQGVWVGRIESEPVPLAGAAP